VKNGVKIKGQRYALQRRWRQQRAADGGRGRAERDGAVLRAVDVWGMRTPARGDAKNLKKNPKAAARSEKVAGRVWNSVSGVARRGYGGGAKKYVESAESRGMGPLWKRFSGAARRRRPMATAGTPKIE
jgi:hypothetical protein